MSGADSGVFLAGPAPETPINPISATALRTAKRRQSFLPLTALR